MGTERAVAAILSIVPKEILRELQPQIHLLCLF